MDLNGRAGAPETPQETALRLAGGKPRTGYKLIALHEYNDREGNPLFWRIRLKHANGDKWIRPMRRNGEGFELGEPKFAHGKPLYLLHDLAKSEGSVFITEGENKADALAALGLTATTSGAADSAGKADWMPLKGRECVAWPDNDEAGAKYSDAVIAALRAVGAASVRVVDVPLLDLPEKGDAVDWLDANPGATVEDVLALATVEPSEATADEWPDALPLCRETPPSEPFPLDALGPVLGDAARCIAEIVQCPDALAGQSVLATATLAAQAHADVEIDGRRFPISNYFVTVAESGERKSAVDGYALAPHDKRQRFLREQYAADMDTWRTEHVAWKKARHECIGKEKGRDAIAAALRKVGDEPAEPLEPMLTTGEPTYEGMVKLLAKGWPTLGLFSDEGGRFIGGHAMNAENMLKTAGGLSELWGGNPVTRTRAGDGNSVLYGRRLSLHLMVQPNVAGLLFGDDLLAGQGLLGRILAAHPHSTKGQRPYKARDVNSEPAYRAYFARLSSLLEHDMPLKEGTRNEIEPRVLTLTADAKGEWVRWHNHVEAQIGPEGPLAPISSLGSKAAEHAARLAGVLALVRDSNAKEITRDDMAGGITLADFYLSEAQRLHEEAAIDADTQTAKRTLAWARRRGGRFATETLYQSGPREVRTKAEADPVLKNLQAHGQIRPLPDGTYVDGKSRRHAWEVHP